MGYTAEISRQNPACLVFVVDQSRSMSMTIESGQTKAQFLADVLNKTLHTMVLTCSKEEGVRDYFYVSIIAYSGPKQTYGNTGARNGFDGALRSDLIQPISRLADNPIRIENRSRKVSLETGEFLERSVKFPVWFEPASKGWTTMCAGLRMAASLARDWVSRYPGSYPPTILHVTDGHPTDGDPEVPAAEIRSVATEDGQAILFNLHVDIGPMKPCTFPAHDSGLPDDYAKRLFRMSSVLPQHLQDAARSKGYSLQAGARGFVFNAGLESIADFFDIGTRARKPVDR